MAHRTQLYLDDSEYFFLKDFAQTEGKSIAQVVRDWVQLFMKKKSRKKAKKKYENDPFFKIRGLFKDNPDVARNFDDYLYGDKK